jgi:hypothetical protein
MERRSSLQLPSSLQNGVYLAPARHGGNDAYLKLHEDLNWFILCPEIRLLHIVTSATERATVLE